MRYRRLGKTSLHVSEIALGTVEIGLEYGLPGQSARPGEMEISRLLHGALDLGINLIDTAPSYGDAESRLGRVLHTRRKDYFLVSKVVQSPGRRDRVRDSVQASLRALRTDTIDILMVHCGPSETEHDADTIAEIQELKNEGLVRFIGSSVYGERGATSALDAGCFDCLQIAYNMLDRRPEGGFLRAAAVRDVGIMVRSVLLKGVLSSRCRTLPDALTPLKAAVDDLLRTMNCDPENLPEFAYRYVLENSLVHTALVGTVDLVELQAAVNYALRGDLPPQVISQIRSAPFPSDTWLNPGRWPICV